MKRVLYFFCSVTLMVAMISCNSKKSEVKAFTKKFISAVNEKDRLTVYDMYPSCKDLAELLPETLDGKKIKVDVDNKTKTYVVSINPEREQRIVVKSSNNGKLQIDDSYGVFKVDSNERELAVRLGVPIKQLSDREYAYVMHKDSAFMQHLGIKFWDELHGNLSQESGYWSWGRDVGGWYMRFYKTIKNKGSVAVSGENYNVEFKLNDYSNNGVSTTKVVPGVDLAPNESHEFMINAPEFYKAANNKTFRGEVIIRFKNMSKAEMLLKYATLMGDEYNNFKNTLILECEEVPDDYESLPDED